MEEKIKYEELSEEEQLEYQMKLAKQIMEEDRELLRRLAKE